MREAAPDPAVHVGTRRVGFVVLLCLSMGVGPYVVHTLSALAPLITDELGLTRTQFGSLVTLSFATATVTSVRSGRLSDQLGSRRTLLVLHATTGIALLALAVGRDAWWVVVAVAFAGFSQSASNPVTNRLVAEQASPGQRGLLLGIKQSGVQLTQFLAGAVIPSVALAIGWRSASAASVLLVLTGGLLTLWLVPPAPALTGRRGPRDPSSRSRHPMVPWLASYGLLLGIVMQGVNVYLPLYSFEVLGFDARLAGATAGVIGALGAIGRIVWGRVAEHVRTAVVPMAAIAAASLVALVLVLLAPRLGPAALWPGVSLFAASTLSTTVVLMMAVVRDVPGTSTGAASGQVMLGVYAGFTVGPLLFGALVDATGGYTVAWSTLIGCAAGALALCLTWWRRPSSDRHHAA